MSSGVERFTLATIGLGIEITTHSQGTHTAQDAAAAVGAEVGAIVKSLVFMAGGRPLLVLASGPNRVDPLLIGQELDLVLVKADADEVKAHTGFSIGGVPPFGHPAPLRTIMDRDLFVFEQVWAAAGSSNAVFPISPQRLHEISGAEVLPIS
jgi:prolyl-tRNA editing enzyme YbaK/EbsC (Cys-tRNA(Pro) deacylase)